MRTMVRRIMAAMLIASAIGYWGSPAMAQRPRGMPRDNANDLARRVLDESRIRIETTDIDGTKQVIEMRERGSDAFEQKRDGNMQLATRIEKESLKAELNREKVNTEISTAQDQRSRRRLKNAVSWAILKDSPSLTRGRITQGEGLNFLLERFDAEILSYGSSTLQNGTMADELFEDATLTADDIHRLVLRQIGTNGAMLEFRADEGKDTIVWPAIVRERMREVPELKDAVEQYELLRKQATEGPSDWDGLIVKLSDAHKQLEEVFEETCSPKAMGKQEQTEVRIEFLRARNMLRVQKGTILRLRELGHYAENSVRYAPGPEGGTLDGLLRHMIQNGLTFGPAKPGDERAYQKIFRMMRDVYKKSDPTDLDDVETNELMRSSVNPPPMP